jgi:hypothetical protein
LGHAILHGLTAFEDIQVNDIKAGPTTFSISARSTFRRATKNVAYFHTWVFRQQGFFHMLTHNAFLGTTPNALLAPE